MKAAFSRSGEVGDLDSNLLGSSSPKLPSSVSRSRGKEYRSKTWIGGNRDISHNNPHPVKVLSGNSRTESGSNEKEKPRSNLAKPRSSRVNSRLGKEIKPKSSFINSKRTSFAKKNFVSESSLTRHSLRNSLKPISIAANARTSCSKNTSVSESLSTGNSLRNSLRPVSTVDQTRTSCSKKSFISESFSTGDSFRNSLKPTTSLDKKGESNSSTVSAESSLQPRQNILEISSRPIGHTSGLLSAVRISLRKSCVTRQAARVETNNERRQSTTGINDDRRQSTGRKSSFSKSSVGSSTITTFDVKSSNCRIIKEETPDSRNVRGVTEVATKKMNVRNVSKVTTMQLKDKALKSRKGDVTTIAKPTHKDTAKPKVSYRNGESFYLYFLLQYEV